MFYDHSTTKGHIRAKQNVFPITNEHSDSLLVNNILPHLRIEEIERK